MAERLAKEAATNHGSATTATTFFTSSDEPEPLEMIRINLEASLLALAGQLKLVFDLDSRCNTSNNNVRPQLGPGLTELLAKHGECRPASPPSDTDANPPKKDKLASLLTPCLSKLAKASQSLLKTLHLVHGVQRLNEEQPRSAIAHSLQHRRDVCFSQAVN